MARALKIGTDMLARGYLPVGVVLVQRGKILADNSLSHADGELGELDHGETVALRRLFANHSSPRLGRITMYSTFEPCLMCYSTAIISGVSNIVYAYEDAMGGGTNLPLKDLKPLYAAKKIKVTGGVGRNKALALFKRYFETPDNAYAGTLLESYTLSAR